MVTLSEAKMKEKKTSSVPRYSPLIIYVDFHSTSYIVKNSVKNESGTLD